MVILPPPTAALYPFESHFHDLDGARMHYLDEGSGEPVLMLHGNPSWSFYYRDLVTAFRGTHRVIAPDHVGCGMSDKPQRYPYTLRRHVENLERLVLDLDLRNVTLVVHDWGGAIGFGVATRHPERFKRLVIFNTARR
jgi:haloalkane dehalogenase